MRIKLEKRAYYPLGSRIVVRPDQAETQTRSGLHLSSVALEPPATGVVIATSEAAEDHGVSVGAKVIFTRGNHHGVPKVPGQPDVIVLRVPEEVLCVFCDDREATPEEEKGEEDAKASLAAARASLVHGASEFGSVKNA